MKQAYCVEADKIITPYEAWNLLFGEEKGKLKHLTFKCPDPHCRVTLLASNLRAVSSPSEVYFKTGLRQKHDPFCS